MISAAPCGLKRLTPRSLRGQLNSREAVWSTSPRFSFHAIYHRHRLMQESARRFKALAFAHKASLSETAPNMLLTCSATKTELSSLQHFHLPTEQRSSRQGEGFLRNTDVLLCWNGHDANKAGSRPVCALWIPASKSAGRSLVLSKQMNDREILWHHMGDTSRKYHFLELEENWGLGLTWILASSIYFHASSINFPYTMKTYNN